MTQAPPKGSFWKLLEARPSPAGAGRIVCVANQKGGVGKTTTAVNLGAALALRGHEVLIVDLDPQANATTGLGIDHRSVRRSTYDLLLGDAAPDDVFVPTRIKNLTVAPAALDLAGAEIELVGAMAREHRLKEAIAGHTAGHEIVFIDCPPSLGLLTVNALVAAADLMVPVQCEYYALEGLGQLLVTAERVRRSLNADLRIAGFVLTMYDARTKLAEQVASEVRVHFGELVYGTLVPRSVRLSEAPSYGEPVVTLDPAARGSVAYRLLAAEVEDRYALGVHVPAPPPGIAPPPPAPASSPAPVPGPAGRGYGTIAPEPPGLDESWPRRAPWTRDVAEAAR
jgi:chromosome partitioning protein